MCGCTFQVYPVVNITFKEKMSTYDWMDLGWRVIRVVETGYEFGKACGDLLEFFFVPNKQ